MDKFSNVQLAIIADGCQVIFDDRTFVNDIDNREANALHAWIKSEIESRGEEYQIETGDLFDESRGGWCE